MDVVFDSELLKDGHLYCPKEYAKPAARFKVIVSLPDENAPDSEMEMAAAVDNADELLAREENEYYLNLLQHGGALDFLSDEREDIYSDEDLKVKYK